MQGGRRQPKIAPTMRANHHNTADIHFIPDGAKIRRLTPTECERLQGFPDGWTELGLSNIMEVCVNINPAIENQLPKSGIVCSIINGGRNMEYQICRNGKKESANIVIQELLPVSSAINTINHGKDTVMLFNQKEMWNTEELTKKSVTLEQIANQSTSKLWKICLEEELSKEKLSIILTSIHEIMTNPTSIFAKIGEDTIGVIIHLNSVRQNYSNEESFILKMGNINQISDTQRYKCLGNAVTVNVIRDIMEKLLHP